MAALSNEDKYRGLLRDLDEAENDLTELKNIANSKIEEIQRTTAFSENMMNIDVMRFKIRLIKDKLNKFNKDFVELVRQGRSRSPNGTRGQRRSRSPNRRTRSNRSRSNSRN
jgi:hypothetical protein